MKSVELVKRGPKVLVAILIQLAVLLLMALGVYALQFVLPPPYPLWVVAWMQGVLAALVTIWLGMPYWWRWIQLFMPWALLTALSLDIQPLWALLAFVLLWLVFSNAFKERVPLYLTNGITRQALKQIIRHQSGVKFLDLGCGLGGNVLFLQAQDSVKQAVGVETAWLPYWIAKIRSLLSAKGQAAQIKRQSLWHTDLGDYQLVYAFLSPQPMAKLWTKVCQEMQPGACFVSNSFAVPQVEPSEVWQLADRRKTHLYIYRIPESKENAL